jgi:hypothetical protein
VFITVSRKISLANATTLVACIAFVSLAAAATADGRYQRTKDGKTIVWNQNPKPRDVATWSGDRDRNGYATGFGTLTWYSTKEKDDESKQTLYAAFFGNMVRGKLDGPVNGHSKGVTNHAIFIQGKRISRWAAGPTPSWKVPPGTLAPETEYVVVAKVDESQNFNPPPPAYDSSVRQRPLPNYDSLREQAPKGQASDIPAEGPGTGERDRTKFPAPIASSRNGPKLEIDDSLRSLTGPPPALGFSSALRHGSGQSKSNANERSSANARLSKQEVINLADAAAETKGFDLSQYKRPEPEFDVIDSTWSVFYDAKLANAATGRGKHFTVAIDDNSRRTAIVLVLAKINRFAGRLDFHQQLCELPFAGEFGGHGVNRSFAFWPGDWDR